MIKKIKQYFLTGIIIIAPLGITVWLLYWIAKFIVRFLHVQLLPVEMVQYVPGPIWLRGALSAVFQFSNFLVGLGVALLLTMLVGALVRTYLGKRLFSFGESIIDRIPFIRSIYNAVKQLTEAIFIAREGRSFKRVVLIEYPRKGVYAIGFVTSETRGRVGDQFEGKTMLNVFMPSTPNPTTGFYMVLPKEDTIPMDLTSEQAFRLIISAGLATSEDENDTSSGKGRKDT